MRRVKHTKDEHCPHPRCRQQDPLEAGNLIPGPCNGALRGFAALSQEERSVISRKGGKKAQKLGRAHKFNQVEAIESGKKGGAVTQAKFDREHFSRIGRAGGNSRAKKFYEEKEVKARAKVGQ
jgi:general stress protein YciG